MKKQFKMYKASAEIERYYGQDENDTVFIYFLEPDNIVIKQVSFYKKAFVIYNETRNIETLYSYNTKIVSYSRNKNVITKHWNDYSRTTMKHIKSFLAYNGIYAMNKSLWYLL